MNASLDQTEDSTLRREADLQGSRSASALHETELLVLPDGRILVHNLSPKMAALLGVMAPQDASMQQRAGSRPGQPAADQWPET